MDELTYLCPHCGAAFGVGDDSEEYLVSCPGCGKTVDLTELEPEPENRAAPETPSAGGEDCIDIDEVVFESGGSAKPDPPAVAVQSAIQSAAATASVIAAAGLRSFRTLARKFGSLQASKTPASPNRIVLKQPNPQPIEIRPVPADTPSKSALALASSFAPATADASESVLVAPPPAVTSSAAATAGAGFAAFAEGRRAEGVAAFRDAAKRGDREAMIALSACLLRGIECRPDLLSARLWQNRAKATQSDIDAMLRTLSSAT
ncbi:MAG: hypothetical protein IJ678_01150 [Kiritimatiellae bacterium]|nr:hypothetical protein [Kiritimatiellia bacterium]